MLSQPIRNAATPFALSSCTCQLTAQVAEEEVTHPHPLPNDLRFVQFLYKSDSTPQTWYLSGTGMSMKILLLVIQMTPWKYLRGQVVLSTFRAHNNLQHFWAKLTRYQPFVFYVNDYFYFLFFLVDCWISIMTVGGLFFMWKVNTASNPCWGQSDFSLLNWME